MPTGTATATVLASPLQVPTPPAQTPTAAPLATAPPTAPPGLSRVASKEVDGVLVRIELQRNPLPVGEVSWVKVSVTNRGRSNLTWMHDGCANIAGVGGISTVAWPMGR